MAQQETYGNWLGPRRPPGIYSVAGKISPLGDFRPASPDSFEDDYDDVSMAGSERGPPPKGVYLLAGPPGSSPAPPEPDPKPADFPNSHPKLGTFGNSDPKLGNCAPNLGNSAGNCGNCGNCRGNCGNCGNCRGNCGNCGNCRGNCGNCGNCRGNCGSPALLAALALLGLAWAGLLALGIGKQQELRAELELLRENLSGAWDAVQQEQTRLRFGIQQHQLEQQELAELLCRALGSSRRCGAGWRPHGSSCFSFSRDALSWARARNACADLGAHLAVVSDESEQVFLVENTNRSSSYWLGMRDTEQEGKWRWVTGEEPGHSFWDVWLREERRERERCGALGPKGRWVSAACERPLRWICEKPSSC